MCQEQEVTGSVWRFRRWQGRLGGGDWGRLFDGGPFGRRPLRSRAKARPRRTLARHVADGGEHSGSGARLYSLSRACRQPTLQLHAGRDAAGAPGSCEPEPRQKGQF